MSDRLCPNGHVVESYRETCSRCNGLVVKSETAELDALENGSVEDPTPMSDENQEEAVSTEADQTPAEENTVETPTAVNTEEASSETSNTDGSSSAGEEAKPEETTSAE